MSFPARLTELAKFQFTTQPIELLVDSEDVRGCAGRQD
jgi:hypothetical protein